MKIGIVSDTHDRLTTIREFLAEFERAEIEALLHLGDIVAPFAAKEFAGIARRVPFMAAFGNNDGERAGLTRTISEWGSVEDGPRRLELGGKVIVIHHYPMAAAEVRGAFPDASVYFSGHTHERVDTREDGLRLINPGEACGWVTGVATAGVYDTDADEWLEIRL